MAHVVYRIVEHDGGWAYRVGDTYSETYPTHEAAKAAAVQASREQKVPDENAAIPCSQRKNVPGSKFSIIAFIILI